jgi:hypothetical protein
MDYCGLQHLYGVTSLRRIIEILGEANKNLLEKFVFPKIVLVGQKSEQLVIITVDGDPNNTLPSNVVLVSESCIRSWKCLVSYKLQCEFGTIHFRSPLDFKVANQSFLAEASYDDFCVLTAGFPLSQEALIRAWEYLTQHHVKGIEQIDFAKHDVSIDQMSVKIWQQAAAIQTLGDK